VLIDAQGLQGGTASVAGDRSSQFLSALLMAAPYARNPVTINVTGELQSKPFVDMTIRLMQDFGVETARSGYDSFTVRPGHYRAREYSVEGDATSAGYFWVAAAVTGGRVKVTNVGSESSQGDRALAGVLERMGCQVRWTATSCEVQGPPPGELRGGTFDLNDIPDQALALAVAGLFTSGPLEITNVWNMRIKETDRLSALATELTKLGADVTEGSDRITVAAAPSYRPAEIATYGDHRMAMAFAIAGLRLPGVTILEPGCVAKTYPDFWTDWQALRGTAGAA
jgi:3-phosphoshikimate 1-carboxyvinyltransferase